MRAFPSPSSAAALRFYGTRHVIVHSARFGAAAALLAAIKPSADYSIVAERGLDVLLRVGAQP